MIIAIIKKNIYNQCDSFFGIQISNSKITSPSYLCLSYQTISYHVLSIQTGSA